MKVNTNQGEAGRRGVGISPNLVKVSERLDMYGNVIDPKTKQIIRKADKEDKKEE